MPHLVQTDNVYAVSVTVINDNELQFSPDPVVITKENSLITFNLLTPGYIFPVDGTALVVNDDDEEEFPIAWYITPVTIGLADYNNDADDYSYTMAVQNIATGARITKDPTIKNNN
ncbi:hypothetical protein [Roseateles cavernae]|uniref:hypothetical protein n=1 Tax=Roseateles cavernae TaxID=3153578 RepID=UPI0032E3CE01